MGQLCWLQTNKNILSRTKQKALKRASKLEQNRPWVMHQASHRAQLFQVPQVKSGSCSWPSMSLLPWCHWRKCAHHSWMPSIERGAASIFLGVPTHNYSSHLAAVRISNRPQNILPGARFLIWGWILKLMLGSITSQSVIPTGIKRSSFIMSG